MVPRCCVDGRVNNFLFRFRAKSSLCFTHMDIRTQALAYSNCGSNSRKLESSCRLSCAMMHVQGTVRVSRGRAVLDLELPQVGSSASSADDVAVPGAPPCTPPAPADVLQLVSSGEINLHHSRTPLMPTQITCMICNQQSSLGLPRGLQGGWSPLAWSRLKAVLEGAKRLRGPPAPPAPLLALPAPSAPVTAPAPAGPTTAPAPAAPTTSDSSSSDSDSDSDSSSGSDNPNTDADVPDLNADVPNIEASAGSDAATNAPSVLESDEYVQLNDAYAELEQQNKDLEDQNIQLRVTSGVLSDRVDTLVMDIHAYEIENANLKNFVKEAVGEEKAAQIARGV